MPPIYSSEDEGGEVKIIDRHTGEAKSVMYSSLILKGIMDEIYIYRLYASGENIGGY